MKRIEKEKLELQGQLDEIGSLKDRMTQLTKGMEGAITGKEEAEEQMEQLKTLLRQRDEECEGLKSKVHELESARATLEASTKTVEEADQANDELSKKLKELETALEDSRKECEEERQKVVDLEKDVSDLRGRSEDGAKNSEQIQELESQNTEAQKRIEELEENLASAEEKLSSLSSETSERDETVHKLEEELNQLRKSNKSTKEELEKAMAKEASMRNEMEAVTKNQSGVESQVQELTTQLEEEKAAHKQLKEQLVKYKAVVKKVSESYKTLSEAHKTTQKEVKELRASKEEAASSRANEAKVANEGMKKEISALKNKLGEKEKEMRSIGSLISVPAATSETLSEKAEEDFSLHDKVQAIVSDLGKKDERIASLEEECKKSNAQLAEMKSVAKDRGTGLASITDELKLTKQENLQLGAKNGSLEEKLSKLRSLLVRANKHIEESKKKQEESETKSSLSVRTLSTLTECVSHHWCLPLVKNASDASVLVPRDIDPFSFVIRERVEFQGVFWVLLEIAEEQSKHYMWTTQDVFLRKRQEKESQNAVDGESTEAGDLDFDATSKESIDLGNGDVLPEEVQLRVERKVKESFDNQWKLGAERYEKTIQDLRTQLEAEQKELITVKDEYHKYKTRAHTVLKSQSEDASKLEVQGRELLELHSLYKELEARHDELRLRTEGFDAAEVEGMREQLIEYEDERLNFEKVEKELRDDIERVSMESKTLQVELERRLEETTEKAQNDLNERAARIAILEKELDVAKHALQEKEEEINVLQSGTVQAIPEAVGVANEPYGAAVPGLRRYSDTPEPLVDQKDGSDLEDGLTPSWIK